VRFLSQTEEHPLDEVRKRYKEDHRKQPFIDRCLLIADCCITLRNQSQGGVTYTSVTQADYADTKNKYHFLRELSPHACFIKQDNGTTTNYLFEVFDATLPRYKLKHRLKDYADYVTTKQWQRRTNDPDPPIIQLACPTISDLIYAKRRTRKLLENVVHTKNIHIRFATIDSIKKHGISSEVWEVLRSR
jgi:hypothetical protein